MNSDENFLARESLDFRNVVDNLQVGAAIFYGKRIDEIIPIYCNNGFLKLSGMTFEEFKSQLIKHNLYGVHPDDIQMARVKFADAYKNGTPINHIIRVSKKENGLFRYILMRGTIKHNDDSTFYVYLTFSDAEELVHSKHILEERYKYLIERSKESKPNLIVALHFNLTKDTCCRCNSCDIYSSVYKCVQSWHKPIDNDTVDAFIYSGCKVIIDEKLANDFKKNYCRESLISCFNKGVLTLTMKFPIKQDNNQVIWCRQTTKLSRNPETNDIECIMTLVDADSDIRLQNSYKVIVKKDYEFVANINLKTGFMRIIDSNKDYGIAFKEKAFYHTVVFRDRIETLVEDEFVDMCVKALSLETIRSELKNKDTYICTFPAKTSLLGHDGAFQWRFVYIGDNKEEVVFTRSEVIGFLDNRQKLQKKLTVAQQNAIEFGEKAKCGFTKRNKILIADDSDLNREMLAIIFEDNFQIIQAADGEEAIRLIDKNYESLALILLDMKMPKKTGLDVLVHLKMRNLQSTIPTILVTGSTSKELGLRSLEYGISDIINKPFDSKIVSRRALNLIELYAHKEDVERQLDVWKEDAIQLHQQAEKNNELLIDALSSVVEFRSIESGTHIKRVRKLTEIMLRTWSILEPSVNLTDSDIEQIARASTLHDIGKVAIPDNILLKPGKLTPEEFEVMKSHTTLGCKFLEQIKQDNNDFYKYCYDICRYHHERADGKGYPDGLKGDDIPFWAQIVSIADVYDALISPRVYKAAFTSEKAIEMIRNGECGNFSTRLLACFEMAKEQIVLESKKMSEEAK